MKKIIAFIIPLIIAICLFAYLTLQMWFHGKTNGLISMEQVDPMFIVFLLCFVCIFALIIFATWYISFYKGNKKIETLFLVDSLVLGFVISLMLPDLCPPDEKTHLYSAYYMSNCMLGISLDDTMIERGIEAGVINGQEDSFLPMRLEDASHVFPIENINRINFDASLKGMFDKAEKTEMVAVVDNQYHPFSLLYFFSALGVTLGRLLGLGTVLTYLLGRWINGLVFTLIAYYAIKKMPFGKSIVFVWALLPIMLQQTTSFSYDCIINALCIFVISLTMYFMYGSPKDNLDVAKEENEKRYKKEKALYYTRIVALICAALVLAKYKGHALILVSMLPLIIPIRGVWKNRNQIAKKIKENRKLNISFWCVLSVFLVAVIAAIFVAVVKIKVLTLPENINNNYIEWADENGYTLGYIFAHPIGFLNVLMNTMWCWGDAYFSQMFGGSLGALDITIPNIMIIPFFLLLLIAGIRKENEEVIVTNSEKVWFMLVWLGTCFLAILAMFLYWTPNSIACVTGVQGRYFLPALIPAMLVVRSEKLTIDKNCDYKIAYMTVFLYVFIAITICRDYMSY